MGITCTEFFPPHSPPIYSIAKQRGTDLVLTKESEPETLDAVILGDKQCFFGVRVIAPTLMLPETLVNYQVNQLIGCQWDVKPFPAVNEGPDDGYPMINEWHLAEMKTFILPIEVLKVLLSKLKGIAEKNLNCCIGTPVNFVVLQGRITFSDKVTNEVHLNYMTSVAYGISEIEPPENYQLNVDTIGNPSMKVCIASNKKVQLKTLAHSSFWSQLGGRDFEEAPTKRPLEKAHSEAGLTYEDSIQRVEAARGCDLQCTIPSPIFKVGKFQHHPRPLYLNKATLFLVILLILLLQSTSVEASGELLDSYLDIMRIIGIVFLRAIAVLIAIAILYHFLYHVIEEPRAAAPQQIDAATIRTFPESTFRAGDHDDRCSICWDDYFDGEILRQLPNCSHRYHHPCIEQWLTQQSPTCPDCRRDQRVPINPFPVGDLQLG